MWSALVPLASAAIGAASSWLGGKSSEKAAKKASERDYENSKEFAQNQIQWRTQDAVKAGLHPLVGAGISPAAGPPGTVVGDMGNAISNMGANISRGVEAYARPEDKVAAKAALLDLEQRQANIDLTRSQIAGAQKALLTAGSTPGVASNLPAASLPLPGSPYAGGIPVQYPGLGQKAEDHYSDVGGAVYGGSAMVNDWLNHIVGAADDYGPFGSRWASVARGAYDSAMNYFYPPPRGGGGGW